MAQSVYFSGRSWGLGVSFYLCVTVQGMGLRQQCFSVFPTFSPVTQLVSGFPTEEITALYLVHPWEEKNLGNFL